MAIASYEGKTAIVTGGASGIGKALGAQLYAAGAHVVLGDLDGSAAVSAASALAEATAVTAGSIVGRAVDVRDEGAVRALVDDIVVRDGRLDFMFNNAGIALGGRTHEMHKAHWDRIIDVNINGVVHGLLAAYPVMIEQGYGHIVNTASGAGLAPAVLTAAYTTTKHAVVGMSTALRPEAAAYGVRISVLCPGVVETPILDTHQPSDLEPRASEALTPRTYLETVGLSPMPASRFAERALRQVARNKAIIVVPGSARALWYLQRLSPAIIERISRRTSRRVLERLAEGTGPSVPRASACMHRRSAQ